MNFSPDGKERKPSFLKSGCGTPRSVSLSSVRKIGDGKPTWKIPLWSKLISAALLSSSQIRLAALQPGNVVFIAAPGADAAANLVDVRGDSADGSSQLLLLGVVHLDDVPSMSIFAGIRAEVVFPTGASCAVQDLTPARSGRFPCGWVVRGPA